MSSAKASLHLLYVNNDLQPRYETQPVVAPQESGGNELAAFLVKPVVSRQSGFRCTLYLPDCPTVVSEVFPKKKEAEQDAAKKALEQMGKSFSSENFTPKVLSDEEKMTALVERVSALFSERGAMICQPLTEHLRAVMRKKDGRHGMVPTAALAALDNKIISICKSLHSSSDTNPVFAMAMVWEATKRCRSVTCESGFWIKSVAPFSTAFQEELLSSGEEEVSFKFHAVYVPCSQDEMVTEIEIEIEPHKYYIEVLASTLNVKDGAGIMISRAIPSTPLAMRLYWPVPEMVPTFHMTHADLMPEFVDSGNFVSEQGACFFKSPGKAGMANNERASNLMDFPVHGDAILASVGSSWRSEGKLSCEDLSLSCYYRLLLGRTPDGNYKLSRDAILVAKLPCSFSSRSQWRGKLPRSLLIEFCHQHRLPDPVFSFPCSKMESGILLLDKDSKRTSIHSYKCVARVVLNGKTIEFESEHLYRNRNDAVQSAALKTVIFLSNQEDAFQSPEVYKSQKAEANGCGKSKEPLVMMGDFSKTRPFKNRTQVAENFTSESCKGFDGRNGPVKTITAGSIVSIAYEVWFVGNNLDVKLEAQEDFEFELGIGGVIGELDGLVSGMHIGGHEEFFLPLPSCNLLLAADGFTGIHIIHDLGCCSLRYAVRILRSLEPPEERMESALFSPPLSKQRNEFAIRKIQEVHAKTLVDLGCGSGSLLDAVFDHPTELEHIAGVDISLKSLLRAAKSLNAKLGPHVGHHDESACGKLEHAVLYEGSLAEPDSRLCGFDVATCMEVVEHMDPEPLSKAGEIILGTLSPGMLVLSTPNIEYNVILQKMTADAKMNHGHCKSHRFDKIMQPSTLNVNDKYGVTSVEPHTNGVATCQDLANLALEDTKNSYPSDDENVAQLSFNENAARTSKSNTRCHQEELVPMDESQNLPLFEDEMGSQSIKLRNEDHRFEWTRAEFMEWADALALKFQYTVEYTGVGGSEEDPGFASQIAIFKSNLYDRTIKHSSAVKEPGDGSLAGLDNGASDLQGKREKCSFSQYREVWKYNKGGISINMD